MNKESPAITRVHNFYVAMAKHLFYHPSYGIVSAPDAIRQKEALHYGMSPLIMYGLSVPGTNVHWMIFSSFDRPYPLMRVLQQAWTTAYGLRGQPDNLCINKPLADSSPGLSAQLASHGVELRVSPRGNMSHPGALRSAQQRSSWLLAGREKGGKDIDDALQALNNAALEDHRMTALYGPVHGSRRERKERTKVWLALPDRDVSVVCGGSLDWVGGGWLYAWESTLPPEQHRYFYTHEEEGMTSLLTGYPTTDEEAAENAAYGLYDNTPEMAKNLIGCWPNPEREVAEFIGVTLQDLRWYIRGKGGLGERAYGRLHSLFDLSFDGYYEAYRALGPYVLVARKPKAIVFVYEELTHDGDAQPVELEPSVGEADPSWRYILITRLNDPVGIVMVARNSTLADQLSELFLNYKGVRSVDPDLYRDVLSTCDRATQSPDANIKEMWAFQRRYRARW